MFMTKKEREEREDARARLLNYLNTHYKWGFNDNTTMGDVYDAAKLTWDIMPIKDRELLNFALSDRMRGFATLEDIFVNADELWVLDLPVDTPKVE
jgi:hypothetical protein